jgi:hypothetical protein
MQRLRNKHGIALPMAIFALVIIGALVAGSFFIGMQEQRVGRNTVKQQQAFAAAEAGAQIEVANWDASAINTMPIGSTATLGGTLTGGSGWYRGDVRRLNTLLFLVRSEGFSADSTARQQVGLLVRLRPIQINIKSALTTQGATNIAGSTQIDGFDQIPGAWTGCPALEPPVPGILLPDTSLITATGANCKDLACVAGSPPASQDTTITADSLTTFGDLQFDELRDMATKIVTGPTMQIAPSTDGGGACNTADQENWGDPLNPTAVCGGYFPIVWVDGNLTINGVQGQGVLVVDGDLSVQGGFEFYGPVLVKGAFKTAGTGGHFNGGVIAANVDLDDNSVTGDAIINYSYCAVTRALQASAPGALLRDRSWVNLY